MLSLLLQVKSIPVNQSSGNLQQRKDEFFALLVAMATRPTCNCKHLRSSASIQQGLRFISKTLIMRHNLPKVGKFGSAQQQFSIQGQANSFSVLERLHMTQDLISLALQIERNDGKTAAHTGISMACLQSRNLQICKPCGLSARYYGTYLGDGTTIHWPIIHSMQTKLWRNLEHQLLSNLHW
jgi:hypothetical protein